MDDEGMKAGLEYVAVSVVGFAGMLLVLTVCTGCGVGPAPREALELAAKIDDERAASAAAQREHLRKAWRDLIGLQFRDELQRAEGGVTYEAAVAAGERLVDRVLRANEILEGYAEVDEQLAGQAARLRKAVAGALRELEERSLAIENLGDAAAGAVEAAAAAKAAREAKKLEEVLPDGD
jgi:hypothetical protein